MTADEYTDRLEELREKYADDEDHELTLEEIWEGRI